MPRGFENVNQENVNLVYDQLKDDHYLRHCLTQQDAMACYNCLQAYKNNGSESNNLMLNSPYGNKYMAAVCTPAGRSINVRDSSNVDSDPCPVNQECAGFTKINSPRHSCTADEITQIKSCAGGTNPVQAPDQNTCGAGCVNDAISGNVQGLPICHKAYPGEGDADENYNQDYVKLTETQCNTSVDFDQDGDGVAEDLSEIYYWSSPLSGPPCRNTQRQYTTSVHCSDISKDKLKRGVTCENIVADYTHRQEPVFCKTGSGKFCSNDDSFDVMDGQEAGRCYGPLPIFGLRGKVDTNGTPIFIDELSNNDKKYCRTRVSCERNPITNKCNVDTDGGIKLNLCENQPGDPGILTPDDSVCQNSFAVNENIDAAAALPEYEFADIPGSDVIKCAKNPWCDVGAVAAASLAGFSIGAAAGATQYGGVLSAAQKTRRAALLASWMGVNGMAQVGASGARDAANNPSSGDLPGTNQVRTPGSIPGLTCGDGLEGCGVNVNLVPDFMTAKPDANKLLDWWKDTSDCNVYWHEGNPVCCDKGYSCLRCDNLL